METVDLLRYEKALLEKGYTLIAGMDEAGRGPLAGPVTVASCIMDLSDIIAGVNDSKQVSEKKREKLYPEIIDKAIAYSVVSIDNPSSASISPSKASASARVNS